MLGITREERFVTEQQNAISKVGVEVAHEVLTVADRHEVTPEQ